CWAAGAPVRGISPAVGLLRGADACSCSLGTEASRFLGALSTAGVTQVLLLHKPPVERSNLEEALASASIGREPRQAVWRSMLSPEPFAKAKPKQTVAPSP
ncbi:Hypothetical predicted protein, partial [Marmota monax]